MLAKKVTEEWLSANFTTTNSVNAVGWGVTSFALLLIPKVHRCVSLILPGTKIWRSLRMIKKQQNLTDRDRNLIAVYSQVVLHSQD